MLKGRVFRMIYSVLMGLLAVACVGFSIDEWIRWQGSAISRVVFLVTVALFLTITSVSVWRRWRSGPVLAGLSGGLLVLYGVAVVLMGWEDVGGASGAIPLALGTGLVGALGVMIGIGGGLERGEAA